MVLLVSPSKAEVVSGLPVAVAVGLPYRADVVALSQGIEVVLLLLNLSDAAVASGLPVAVAVAVAVALP